MALIEFKRCPHCGKTTWQEFVPQAPPAPSYWRCRDCGDRRDARRISVGQSALLNHGRIQTDQLCADVLIVDISPRGAKLRSDEEMPVVVREGERLLFNPQLQPFGELARYHPSIVRWIRDGDFGVHFERPLAMASVDIMRIVKN
ncbi:type IV pilus assembly PilZ [Solidesulfovibrio carbinoliphilus subsp. oakridgensis]|uniref:Type IV pilus assembly PilZ n=1 Tax=Solidesulfovibrio carbinoliphilus subsp. oakridgensis TaxID=694327 RepID=G7Q7D0_9BACT|nr:PilZ domain-containing protein [Solidesulfovibrio carbinoliphilus]EHJ49641.1 type IV pilus assembly PilZ [Solidesulfovibrio carbinoliphilus subsp. oakridgensis]